MTVPAARWAPMVLCLVIAIASCSLVYRIVAGTGPRPAPTGLCAQLPADLLHRLVPAAGDPQAGDDKVTNGQRFTNRATCERRTDRSKAPTTASGNLRVDVDRFGDLGEHGPDGQAQEDFARGKRFAQRNGIVRQRVSDLVGLGDSGYLSIALPDRPADGRSTAEVRVLKGDTVLRVRYTATPSTDELVAAAAVAMAKSLSGVLR